MSAMRVYAIVTGDDPKLQHLDFNHDDNYDDWKAQQAEAAFKITLSCSAKVRRSIKGIRHPHEMWNT